MHLIYLDESGDPGLTNSPGHHYIIAGFAVHSDDWHAIDARLRGFRAWAKEQYGLREDHEIHAAEFLGAANVHCGLRRDHRLLIVRSLLRLLSESPELRFFGWIADKNQGAPLHRAGERCLSDLEHWVQIGSLGIRSALLIIHDQMPTMPVAWERDHFARVVGRPLSLPSNRSRQLQIADLIAYLIKQSKHPNRYLKEQGAHQLIKKLTELSLGWIEV